MKKIKIPNDFLKDSKKPNLLILSSLITTVVANCITIFGFEFLDLNIKIIISLSILSFILLIDVIVLYTQYYKYYYQSEYLNKIYSLIDMNVDNLGQSLKEIQDESDSIKESVIENTNNINLLKSKIL